MTVLNGQWRIELCPRRAGRAQRRAAAPGRAHRQPTRQIADRAAALIPRDAQVVTYCWGPGCNGATRAALELALLGYHVKEMLGGYEYWVREGLPVQTATGRTTRTPDPLTSPPLSTTCAC